MRLTLEIKFAVLCRWLLGLALLWAGLGKLANMHDFCASLSACQLPLPDLLQRLTAICLPWLQLLCGLMLLADYRADVALAWAVVLFSVSLVTAAQAWARGLDLTNASFEWQWLLQGKLPQFIQAANPSAWVFSRSALLLALAFCLRRSLFQAQVARETGPNS